MPAAALVTLLMAAVEAFSMMVPAFVSFTVVAALMPFSMVMPAIVPLTVMMAVVVAFGIGIILQRAIRQSLRGCVGRTGNTTVELDPRFGKRSLRAHADAAAD